MVDADACPRSCLQIMLRYSEQRGFRLVTVASVNHQISHSDHITVGPESDAADIAVMNILDKGDVVVTQDWGLAALVLGKKAYALGPTGRVYSSDTIDFMLEERALKAKFRRGGGRTKGPSARTKEDDQRFEREFVQLLDIALSES